MHDHDFVTFIKHALTPELEVHQSAPAWIAMSGALIWFTCGFPAIMPPIADWPMAIATAKAHDAS